MSALREPLGHADTVRGLWRAAAAGRLHHALMLSGERGTGRYLAATWFAAGLLCEQGPLRAGAAELERPCGTCPSCKKLSHGAASNNHPDLFTIDPVTEGAGEIVVGRIALRSGAAKDDRPSLAEFLGLKASEGGARVVLIREAERMNESAQNALLKTLEEPAPNTYLVLECGAPQRLLPTIRSRVLEAVCQGLGLDQVHAIVADAVAGDDVAFEPAEVERLAVLAGNSPGRGLELARRGAGAMLGLLDDLRGRRIDPALAADRIWAIEAEFPGERPLQRERERTATLLELALASVEAELLAGLPASSGPAAVLQPQPPFAGAPRARALALMELQRDLARNLDPAGVLTRALGVL